MSDSPAAQNHNPAQRCVAVVGAGVAGLVCARALAARGHDVTVFDKGYISGGRLSTRTVGQASFDLGAQYFTARDPRFEAQVRAWCNEGVCVPWQGRVVAVSGYEPEAARDTTPQARYVGTPTMAVLAHALGRGLCIQNSVCVEVVTRDLGGRLALRGRRPTKSSGQARLGPAGLHGRDPSAFEPLGSFDAVVLAMPPSQAAWLAEPLCPGIATELRSIKMDPCFALGFCSQDVGGALASLPFDGVFVGRPEEPGHSALSWVAREPSKEGRSPAQAWVLHATPEWTSANVLRPESEVAEELLAEFSRLFDLPVIAPETVTLMRWMLARAPEPLHVGVLNDAANAIYAGGDWAHGGRVEGAFLSGVALAESVSCSGVSRDRAEGNP